jgi:protein tyrosine phosphatase (PTP) superfamily phosphohydrolase (DUF442 family)
LATAGQPTETQLQDIASGSYQVVINLGLYDQKYCLQDEKGLVRSLGMNYYHIPVNFQAPKLEDLEKFFLVMDETENKKIFIHCAANKRVSCFLALYGENKLGWSREKADALIHSIWKPDKVWSSFIKLTREQK